MLLNGALAYNQAWKKSGISVGASLNANQSEYVMGNSLFVGAGLNGGAPLIKKKLRTSAGVNVNQNYEAGVLVANLITANNSYSLKFGNHHVISASIRYSGRTKIANAEVGRYNNNYNEFLGSLAYNLTF